MVILTPRFNILAAFCFLAVLSDFAGAAVLPSSVSVINSGDMKREQIPLPASAETTQIRSPHAGAHNKHHKQDGKKAKKTKPHHKSRNVLDYFLTEGPFFPPSLFSKRAILISRLKSPSYVLYTPRSFEDGAQKPISMTRRFDIESGVPGVIDVMSKVAGSPNTRIASLNLESSADNSSFVMNASEHNMTQVFLAPVPEGLATPFASAMLDPGNEHLVNLRMELFNATKVDVDPYCMTYNPQATQAEPLRAKMCSMNSTEHECQIFSYNSETGIIRPMWFDGGNDGKTDDMNSDVESPTATNSASPMATNVTEGSGPPNSTDSSNSTLSTQDTGASPPQSVTLVFTPSTPAAPMQDPDSGSSSSDTTETESMDMTSATSSGTTMTSSTIASTSPIAAAEAGSSMTSTTTASTWAATSSGTASFSSSPDLNVEVAPASNTHSSSEMASATIATPTSATDWVSKSATGSVLAPATGTMASSMDVEAIASMIAASNVFAIPAQATTTVVAVAEGPSTASGKL